MTDKTSKTIKATWYGELWAKFKSFPQGIATSQKNAPEISGPAAAALISASFSCFLMMFVHHLSDTSKATEKIVWMFGSWIPGSKNPDPMWGNIGSYTGKETFLLVGWLISWPILHWLWRKTQIKATHILLWMLSFLVAATAMSWHPLFPYLPLT